MSKSVKRWLFAAAALVLIGLAIFAAALAKCDWDFTKLGTVKYVTNTYKVSEKFDKISIDVDTTDIEFVLSEDGACSIVCLEEDKARHSAFVQNGALVIKIMDTRKWYDYIRVSLGTPKMTVYLPKNEYASLFIETDTGDITVPKDFTFERLEIDGDTSDIDCFASVLGEFEVEVSTGDLNLDTLSAGRLKLATDTGDIILNALTVKNEIEIETDTGEVELSDSTCADIALKTDTGDVTLKKIVAAGNLPALSDTGDISFYDSDAAQISVNTDTGDVSGRLLSEKIFITETSTGRVRVPKTTSGGKCAITTSTGDIDISIRQ